MLVEKHLISPNLANESRNGAVILSENEAVSIMINEEDHLRIQCLYPGISNPRGMGDWRAALTIFLKKQLDYAFDERTRLFNELSDECRNRDTRFGHDAFAGASC